MSGTAGPEVVQELRQRMRGRVIEPADPDYDEARAVWNADVDRWPGAIARCAGVADVIACVETARARDVLASVRCSGHNIGGVAVCDGGLVIELSPMKGIRVDPGRRRARAQGGCLWGDYDHACAAFGLASTGGVNSITGISGITLGGGIGWLMRKHGLACDNVVSCDVVTADGRFVVASEDENPDLFWGLRGGGGNFGIVTEFEYRLHPVDRVLGGLLLYPAERARDLLRFYREYSAVEPEELTTFVILLDAPATPELPKELHGAPMIALCVCYAGPLDAGERVIDELRDFGPAVLDTVAPTRYVDVQRGSDDEWRAGFGRYWRSDYVRELSDDAIDTIVAYCERFPRPRQAAREVGRPPLQPTCYFEIGHMEGAISRVGENDTAVGHRGAPFLHGIFSVWTDPADREEQVRWVRDSWDALVPFSSGGAYVNYLGAEGAERVRGAYASPDKYERLVDLKSRWDPTNFFAGNQNIQPSPQLAPAA